MKTTTKILKYVITGGLFLIPFIPFIVPNTMFFPFITGKGFTFRILVELLFGLYVILAVSEPLYRPKLSWITKSVLFFTLAILVADIFGENSYKSLWSNYERMEGFVLIFHLFLYYIVASSFFQTVKEWVRYFNVSILASVGTALFAISQLLGKSAINQGSERVDATFGNAAYFAVYLLLHIFLCLYLLVGEARKTWEKWVYGSIAVLEMVILYFTATRGAILGLIGGLILTGLIMAFKGKENPKLRKFAYGILGAVAIVILGFLAIKNTDYAKSSPVLSRFTTLSFSEIKNQGRYFVWPMAVKGFMERPILGWGQENFNFVFNKYYDPGLYGQEEWFDRTHDVFLDWLIAGGLIGLLSYLSMYAALLYYVWRRGSTFSLLEKSIFSGLITAYIFHNIFVFDNLISYIIFFSLLAYMHAVNTPRKEESGKFYTQTFSGDVVAWLVVPVTTLFTAGLIYYVNVPALIVNKTLIQSIQPQEKGIQENYRLFNKIFELNSFGSTEALEQLTQATAQIYGGQFPDKVKMDFYNLTAAKLEEKINEVPNDARYLVFAGSFYNRFGQYDIALKYLERALKESPNKLSIYYEMGSSYLGKGDRQKLFEVFKKAYELKPTSDQARILYMIGGLYANNQAVVKEMSALINPESLINDQRFLKVYSDIGDYNMVIKILTARLEREPGNLQNKLSLASTYATIGQKEKAISLIREIIAAEPSFKSQGELYIQQIRNQ